MRVDGRQPDEMRTVNYTLDYIKYAEGSVLIEVGDTRVICNATVDNSIPPHLIGQGKGWVTAEYAMLPRATNRRNVRDSVRGRIGGRSHEIQRLIGRALRSVVNLRQLGEKTIYLDCDVIQADGGTRTASVTGSFVAMVQCLQRLKENGKIGKVPVKDFLAATNVGIVEGRCVLDLCYLEDAQADVDMNIVMTGSGEFVELQGTAEGDPFSSEAMNEMIALAKKGVTELVTVQKELLGIETFSDVS